MYKVEVKIKGVVPLLQHRFPTEKAEKKSVRSTGDRSEEYAKEAVNALYKDERGMIYQPADHILGALAKAAGDFKITGRGRKTYRDMFKSSVVVTPDAIPHEKPTWEVDRRPVVIKGSRILRERPKFMDWSLSFNIEVLEDQLPDEVLKDVLEQAGKVGIGDYRPRFGRFMVTKFERVQ
jgi:hypothetical protein